MAKFYNSSATELHEKQDYQHIYAFTGTIPKPIDFNNNIRRRLTLIHADATLNLRESALICI